MSGQGTSAPGSPARLRPYGPFLLAFGWSFALWVLSPLIAGTREPWDASWPFYSLWLGLGGLAGGWLLPRRWIQALLGLWLGQVPGMALAAGGDHGWIVLGVVTSAIGAQIGFLAYLIGWLACHAWRRFRDGG